ncbi:IS1 family transposase [Candidiatus Paracoxiella cheracis]|uniref:IS1 family transposase n=1 Tax=Candidiatus Paracoxiella cheracis TaxID=3405120 RepID=UPI003BF57262
MARINVACPCCCLHEVVKFGVSSTGKQRFQCKNNACEKNTFLLDYTHNARAPGVKDKIQVCRDARDRLLPSLSIIDSQYATT